MFTSQSMLASDERDKWMEPPESACDLSDRIPNGVVRSGVRQFVSENHPGLQLCQFTLSIQPLCWKQQDRPEPTYGAGARDFAGNANGWNSADFQSLCHSLKCSRKLIVGILAATNDRHGSKSPNCKPDQQNSGNCQPYRGEYRHGSRPQ